MNRKAKTVILDSSVWIAYFHKYDSHHKRAVNIMKEYKECQFIVPEIVYFETLTRIFKLTESFELIKNIQNNFKVNKSLYIKKMARNRLEKLFMQYITKVCLKSSDFQILLYTLEYYEAEFKTFDKRLKREYYKNSS